MQPSHRHYPPSLKDNEVFTSHHSDADMSRLDRSRSSGHDPGYIYVDKFSRDDHMEVDSSYPSRGPYEEPVRLQDVGNRTSSHNDAISRGPIPPALLPRSRDSVNAVSATSVVSASTIVAKTHRRSRDRSPQHHHESRQMSKLPSSASLSLSTTQSGSPQDVQSVENYRHRGRRIDRDREVYVPSVLVKPVGLTLLFLLFQDNSPTLPRHSSNQVPVRSRSTGRYDVPDGGTNHVYLECRLFFNVFVLRSTPARML
jgi:hypothetical protein